MSHPRHSPYFFIDEKPTSGGTAIVRGTDARHLRVVRRARVGDTVTISDGRGSLAPAEIIRLEASEFEVRIGDVETVSKSLPSIRVLQGLAKGTKLDFTIQKLVELGVDRIEIFLSGRTVPRWDELRTERAVERWAAIAREAAKQSRRAWIAGIDGPFDLSRSVEVIRSSPLSLVLHEQASQRLRASLPAEPPPELLLVVGPEGGLSGEEVEAMETAGAVPVGLGPQILRTETAALAAASAVLYAYGILG